MRIFFQLEKIHLKNFFNEFHTKSFITVQTILVIELRFHFGLFIDYLFYVENNKQVDHEKHQKILFLRACVHACTYNIIYLNYIFILIIYYILHDHEIIYYIIYKIFYIDHIINYIN